MNALANLYRKDKAALLLAASSTTTPRSVKNLLRKLCSMTDETLRTLWDAFIEMVRQAIKLPGTKQFYTALEAVFEIQQQTEAVNDSKTRQREYTPPTPAPMVSLINEDVHRAVLGAAKQAQQSVPKLLSIANWNHIADAADRFFTAVKEGGVNPVRALYNLREERRVRADALMRGAQPLLQRHTELERKYKGEVWDNYAKLVHDETNAGVFADKPLTDKANAHVGKESLAGHWSRKQHADLTARFAALPEDLKALRQETLKYYTDQQNQMSLDILKNRVLTALGVDDAAMAQRIFDETHTEADTKAVGGEHIMDLIQKAASLKKIKGPKFLHVITKKGKGDRKSVV
mgnify:CR=1 FL=1